MRNGILASCAMLTAISLTSCEQKDLCLDHWSHAFSCDIMVETDWQLKWEYKNPDGVDWSAEWPEQHFGFSYESLDPLTSSGIRCLVYQGGVLDISNIDSEGGKIYMRPGESSMLFFNNDTEHILFSGIDKSATAMASTQPIFRSSYLGSPFSGSEEGENTVSPPDFLFSHYIEEYKASASELIPTLSFTMKPLVFRYLIRVSIEEGRDYAAVARGALSGMASSVFLTDGRTDKTEATLMFDFEMKDFGMEAVVNSFGLPNLPDPDYSRGDEANGLNVEIRLKNGKIINHHFNVTDLLSSQPRGGVIELGGIVITEEEGKESTGSFDVDVNGWGEYEDVPIIL